MSLLDLYGQQAPWETCGARERVRSASLNFDSVASLLGGRTATRPAANVRGLVFCSDRFPVWDQRRSKSHQLVRDITSL